MMKYEKVNIKNLKLATKIQMEIFPNESAYQEFIDCLNSNKEYNQYFIVYDNNQIIGITGLYTETNIYKYNTIWLGWFGILKEQRRKGYGNKVLLDTIDMVKKLSEKYPIKYFRVFTSTVENPDVIPLYNKILDYKESYKNPKDQNFNNTCVIYTKVLNNNKYQRWNNEFLNISKMIEKEKIGNDLFNNN